MIASYAVTTMLASAGGKDRDRQSPFLAIAMGAKILGDSAVAIKLAQEEWQENKKLCAYCQVATLASVALAAPELISAVRNLLGSK